jgi:hypothetical protein
MNREDQDKGIHEEIGEAEMCRSRSSSEQRASLDRDGIADEDCLPTEKMSVTEPAQGRMRGRGMKKQTAASRMPVHE